MQRRHASLVPLGAAYLILSHSAGPAWGWGGPHRAITEAALRELPDWQKEMLGTELAPLGAEYCFIPDWIFSRKEWAKYATMDSKPGEVYIINLHLSATQQEDYEVLRSFLSKAVNSARSGNMGDSAKYAGTLAHVIEDWGCPAHAVPGDNQFTLIKQLLPPPESYRYKLLHSAIEGGSFAVDIGGYQPRLLGTSVPEAAFRLLHRVHEATLVARAQVLPIVGALYAGDQEAVTAAQTKAGTADAEVIADGLYTLLCLARQQFEPQAKQLLETADLSERIPLEATGLAVPQSSFFGKPYWGQPLRDVVLKNGGAPVALRLDVEEAGKLVERGFERGIGLGTRSVLTYLVPEGVFARFEALVGLHSQLGANGSVVFEVQGNGKSLVRTEALTGGGPAQRLSVPLTGVTEVRLITSSGGGDGTGNYAVWGEPKLVK